MLVNEGEWIRKLPKMFTSKHLQMTQKSITCWFNQKKAWHGILKIDACAAAKRKIILSSLQTQHVYSTVKVSTSFQREIHVVCLPFVLLHNQNICAKDDGSEFRTLLNI